MVDGAGADRFDDGEFVNDLRGVRQEFTDPAAAFPVLCEVELAWGDGESRLAGSHGRDALTVPDAIGKVFVEVRFELGFVVPEVQLGGSPIHVKVDDPLGFWRVVREAGDGRMNFCCGCGCVSGQETCECDSADAKA